MSNPNPQSITHAFCFHLVRDRDEIVHMMKWCTVLRCSAKTQATPNRMNIQQWIEHRRLCSDIRVWTSHWLTCIWTQGGTTDILSPFRQVEACQWQTCDLHAADVIWILSYFSRRKIINFCHSHLIDDARRFAIKGIQVKCKSFEKIVRKSLTMGASEAIFHQPNSNDFENQWIGST